MSEVKRRSWAEDRARAERLLALFSSRGGMTSYALWMASDDADSWSLEAVQMRFTAWRRAGIIAVCPRLGAPFYVTTGRPLPDFEAADALRRARIASRCAERNRARAGKRSAKPQRLTDVPAWLAI